jgi:hypothetical protein
VQFAGFAEAARGLIKSLLLAAGVSACAACWSQTAEAQNWYSQGVQALNEKRFADARAALLQAVAADPTFAGAWLDLAIAAHAEGDAVQAEEFLTILEARFTLPAPIASGVANLRRRIQAQREAASAGWRWRHAFQGGGGYDTNANGGLSLADLTLTFPGGNIVLPLTGAQRPQADRYVLASLAADGWRSLGSGQLEIAGSAKSRVNANLREFDTVELQAGMGYSSPQPAFSGPLASILPGPWRVGAVAQQLRLGGNSLLESVALSAIHAWSQSPCRPQGGVELDLRHFPVASNLDSGLLWLSAQGSCPSPLPGPGARFSAQIRAGWELARSDSGSDRGRPGGDTHHLEVTASHQWSWAGRNGTHRLEAQAQWARARDTEGYSPLLAENARRSLTRASGALAYTVPLRAGREEDAWLGSVIFQAFRQRSNLEVFRLKGQALQFTLKKSW